MQILYPAADWRPLGDPTSPLALGIPRLFIIHTMVGSLLGTDSYFKFGNGLGYIGAESTFGVGGSTDGPYDGRVFQWARLDRRADAQFSGNLLATSVETSDGGNPSNPWGPKQLQAIINLGIWWCRQTGQAPVLTTSPTGSGFGWHAQFEEWNHNHHVCPGAVRLKQYTGTVIPMIQRALLDPAVPIPPKPKPKPTPKPISPAFPLPSGHWFGVPSSSPQNHSGYYSSSDRAKLSVWQRQMRARGWTINVDGRFSPETQDVTKAFQAEKKLGVDGLVGPATWKAAWLAQVT